MDLLLQAALREKAKRTIRKSFHDWCVYLTPDEQPALHHRFLIDKLQALSEGHLIHSVSGDPCRKLMILMPPGSAKSTYTSIAFPPWYLSNHHKDRILVCSHSSALAESFSQRCVNIIKAESEILGYELTKEAVKTWSTNLGGSYVCAGVGSGLAGYRAYFGLIDDYIGNEEDADSKQLRDKQYTWYQNDFWTRLTPTAPVAIVANRRHWDDLVGRIIDVEANEWEIIKLPFFAGEHDPLNRVVGERLWPEYFTEEHANSVRRKPSRTLAGLFQQDPHPEGGDYFKSDYLIGYNPGELPKQLNYYCASDHACSKRKDSDSSLLVPYGVDLKGNVWILPSFWWGRGNTGEIVTEMLRLMKEFKPTVWCAETEHIVKSIGPFLRDRMRDEMIYTTRLQELSGGRDKAAKARSIQGRMEFHQVFFPKFHPRWSEVEHELMSFNGADNDVHDEWPDVLGVIGRFLEAYQRPHKPAEPEKVVTEYTYGWLKQSARRKELAREMAMDN